MTISVVPEAFLESPREYSLLPFWFWNDDLCEQELARQMGEFEAHGVHGFVIHARVGLPRSIGWMSPRMLELMRFVVEEAARRDMRVVLYDEGMYPSGSSSGQVVADDARFACRGLAALQLPDNAPPTLAADEKLVAMIRRHDGQTLGIIDRPARSIIRGLHYIGEGPEEETPPAADILNPDAVACFIRLVYDRYAQELGEHFGRTIIGVFTDEPGLLGRDPEGGWSPGTVGVPEVESVNGVAPGTTGILEHVNRILGYDFTPHLPCLWFDDEPEAARRRAEYHRAVGERLAETYYRPLSQWAEDHGVALMGHPARPDALGLERYFQVPGQDLVLRKVMPDEPSALEGAESTQAKCSASAMIHLGRRRNSNECFGGYGHELMYEQMTAMVDWCLVRGVNMLMPHAFYYSIRGPRRDERPPDVGPNSAWWPRYKPFADYCRRMCWLNSDCRHICHVAILGLADHLPWSAAKVCLQHQRDFNYVEARHLWEDATVDHDGLRIADMHYRTLIVDGLDQVPRSARRVFDVLLEAGRVVAWRPPDDHPWPGAAVARTGDELVAHLDRHVPPDLAISPSQPDLRYRHVVKGADHYYLLLNEGTRRMDAAVNVAAPGRRWWIDPMTMQAAPMEGDCLVLPPHALRIVLISRTETPEG